MSKYLIKPIGSIWRNPDEVYSMKRDLLMYDQLGMLNRDKLLEDLYVYRNYPKIQSVLNELEYLIRNNLFIELKELIIPFAQKGTALIDSNDSELGNFTMQLVTRINEEKNPVEKDRLYWMHDELNTRVWCNIVNLNNEDVYTVPSLQDYSTFDLNISTKYKAYNIIHRLIPMPSNDTPWEKIFDFRDDEESKLKLYALKNWINDLPEHIKKNELEDKIHYLLAEYTESLKRHKIQSKLSTFKTIVTTVPTVLTEIVRLKFDKAIEAFFSIAEQQVNFDAYKEKSEFKGNELAYVSHVNTRFANKTNNKKKK